MLWDKKPAPQPDLAHLTVAQEQSEGRAAAAKLLFDTFARRRSEAHHRYVAPFREGIESLGRLVFGAADPKAGACGSLYNLCADPRLNHEVPVTAGVAAPACAALLTDFFAARRNAP